MKTSSIDELSHEVTQRGATIITVDGRLGVGKTTVAKLLSNHIDYDCLHLDNFITTRKGQFVNNLDFASLKAAVRERPIIIEGICLLAVLKKLNITADLDIFVKGLQAHRNELDKNIFDEVDMYIHNYEPSNMAGVIFDMNEYQKNTSDAVDIAYIKAKTTLSVTLAIGGILSILVGALVFTLGLESGDTAIIKLAGIELSAKGIGGVILITSAAWAYIAYLARPIYRRQHEVREITNNDGSKEKHTFVSTTQIEVRPEQTPNKAN